MCPCRRANDGCAGIPGEDRGPGGAAAGTLPALGALTVCVPRAAALLSLAAPSLANARQLRAFAFAEPGGALPAALAVRGHHAPFLAACRAGTTCVPHGSLAEGAGRCLWTDSDALVLGDWARASRCHLAASLRWVKIRTL